MHMKNLIFVVVVSTTFVLLSAGVQAQSRHMENRNQAPVNEQYNSGYNANVQYAQYEVSYNQRNTGYNENENNYGRNNYDRYDRNDRYSRHAKMKRYYRRRAWERNNDHNRRNGCNQYNNRRY